MSLWTPGGEHEVPRETAPDSAAEEAPRARPTDMDEEALAEALGIPSLADLSDEEREQLEAAVAQMAETERQLATTPADVVIANHAMGMYELAAIHLRQDPPNLPEARLSIDALSSVLNGLQGRLGQNEQTLVQALSQLQQAFVAIATHLPRWTERWMATAGVEAHVVFMGGSLEGVCARGMADAIVDLRETGGRIRRNRLRVLAEGEHCQAIFSWSPPMSAAVADLSLRLEAALDARSTQYVMLHIPADQVDELSGVFPGLAAPTVLPLSGREDLVAAHIVVQRKNLWARLGALRELGATGIVALPTDAILK